MRNRMDKKLMDGMAKIAVESVVKYMALQEMEDAEKSKDKKAGAIVVNQLQITFNTLDYFQKLISIAVTEVFKIMRDVNDGKRTV